MEPADRAILQPGGPVLLRLLSVGAVLATCSRSERERAPWRFILSVL